MIKKLFILSAFVPLFLSSCEKLHECGTKELEVCEMQDPNEIYGSWYWVRTESSLDDKIYDPTTSGTQEMIVNQDDSTITYIHDGVESSLKYAFTTEQRISNTTNKLEYFLDSYPIPDPDSWMVICGIWNPVYYEVKCDTLYLYDDYPTELHLGSSYTKVYVRK